MTGDARVGKRKGREARRGRYLGNVRKGWKAVIGPVTADLLVLEVSGLWRGSGLLFPKQLIHVGDEEGGGPAEHEETDYTLQGT